MARHHPPDEQRFHADVWRRSGRSLTAYALQIGVSQQTLSRWVKRHPTEALPPFVDITPTRPFEAKDTGLRGSIAGCDVRFDTLPPSDWFAQVLCAASAH